MFPNVRLMIVAVVASLVGISCGLAILAVFRVNHDPFARLPGAAPPLQLVFSNAASAPVTDATAAPFGVRFQVQAPYPASALDTATEPPPLPRPADDAIAAARAPNAQESEPTADTAANAVTTAALERTAPDGQTVKTAKRATEPDATSTKVRPKAVHAAAKRERTAPMQRRVRKARARPVDQSANQNAGLPQPSYEFTSVH